MAKGLIACLIAGQYTIYDLDDQSVSIAKPRGIFRIKGVSPEVGDYVEYNKNAGDATITSIEKRTTNLVRPAICNISQAFVVFSVKEPELNLNLLDRFITILEYYNIVPILVFNKWDLLTDQKEIEEVTPIIDYYKGIGYKTIQNLTEVASVNVNKAFLSHSLKTLFMHSSIAFVLR